MHATSVTILRRQVRSTSRVFISGNPFFRNFSLAKSEDGGVRQLLHSFLSVLLSETESNPRLSRLFQHVGRRSRLQVTISHRPAAPTRRCSRRRRRLRSPPCCGQRLPAGWVPAHRSESLRRSGHPGSRTGHTPLAPAVGPRGPA